MKSFRELWLMAYSCLHSGASLDPRLVLRFSWKLIIYLYNHWCVFAIFFYCWKKLTHKCAFHFSNIESLYTVYCENNDTYFYHWGKTSHNFLCIAYITRSFLDFLLWIIQKMSVNNSISRIERLEAQPVLCRERK